MKQAILCVDDEAIIVLSLKQELRSHYRERFVYETALSAADALAAIEELEAEDIRVIAVISDWLMPGVRGDEFLMKVRATHPDLKAIVMTGQADLASLAKLSSEGCLSAVLLKPWRQADLIAAVDRCLEQAAP